MSICPPYHRVLYRYGHYSGSTLTFKVHKVDSSIQGKDGLLHRTVDCVVMETTTKLTCFVHSKFIYLLVSNEIDGQSASVGCINVFYYTLHGHLSAFSENQIPGCSPL